MITEQDNLCYCILTLQYVKRHYVAGYLLIYIIITLYVVWESHYELTLNSVIIANFLVLTANNIVNYNLTPPSVTVVTDTQAYYYIDILATPGGIPFLIYGCCHSNYGIYNTYYMSQSVIWQNISQRAG